MKEMRLQSVTSGAVLGILAPSIFLVLYSIAIWIDDVYVFGENYLSDLGVGEAAWAFNLAVVSAGLLMIAMAVLGLRPVLGPSMVSLAGIGLLIMAGVFLVLVGIFTEDFGDIHGMVSYAFFTSVYVSVGVLAFAFNRTKALGRLGVIVSGIVFFAGVILAVAGGTPLAETIAVFVAVAWGYAVSIQLLLRERGFPIP